MKKSTMEQRQANMTTTEMDFKTGDRLRLEMWPISRLTPSPRNARTHSAAQVAEIAGSIRAFGFSNPILVGEDGDVIAGHGRLAAARQLGLTEVPVIVLSGLDELQRRQLMLADNRIASECRLGSEMLALELKDLIVLGADSDGAWIYEAGTGTLRSTGRGRLHRRERGSRTRRKRRHRCRGYLVCSAPTGSPAATAPISARSRHCSVELRPEADGDRPALRRGLRSGLAAPHGRQSSPSGRARSATTTSATGRRPGRSSPATSPMSGTAPCMPRRWPKA